MNELAYYLDRYFARLELQELLEQKGTELSEDALNKQRERQAKCNIALDEMMSTEERLEKDSLEAVKCEEPTQVAV